MFYEFNTYKEKIKNNKIDILTKFNFKFFKNAELGMYAFFYQNKKYQHDEFLYADVKEFDILSINYRRNEEDFYDKNYGAAVILERINNDLIPLINFAKTLAGQK